GCAWIARRPPSGIALSALEKISVNACSSRIGSTRTSGSAAAKLSVGSTRCWRSNSEKPPSAPSTSARTLSRSGRNGAGRENASRCAILRSRRSTCSMMACNCSRAAGGGASTRRWASWAAAGRLASGFRSPWATAAAICPIEASFSDCTSCARDWRDSSAIRAVARGQGRLQAAHEVVPRGKVCRLALPGVVEFERVSRDGTDVPVDLAHAIRELRFFRRKARRPPFEPVAHDLLGERELLLGGGISAQVAPDHLGLVEHGVFHFRVRPRVGQALTERLERAALQRVTANRLDPDEQRGDHRERDPKQQLALEGHDGLAAPRARRGGTVPGISHMT